jgi:RimJ/RimL family protein N-acetyltransferase
MEFVTRKAGLDDVPRLGEIEKGTLPRFNGYTYECRHLFIEQQGQKGEMTIVRPADAPDEPASYVGIGQFSVMPDGSGWMECLRILPAYQRKGAGLAIYRRYMELAEAFDVPHVGMFTDNGNVASKALAERHGFHVVAAYDEYTLPLDRVEAAMPAGFERVTDRETVAKALDDHSGMGDHIVFNRTYLHYGPAIYEWLIDKGMVWSDGENLVVLGARMLEERGWFMAFWQGDSDRCLAFASAKTKEAGLPALGVNFPSERTDLKAYFESKGFRPVYSTIVMERKRR